MSGKLLSTAALMAVFGGSPVFADLRGPAEAPPPGFKGQQYVDSRGCVFLRAGHGGQISWVPRVSADRKQLCGAPGAGSKVEIAEVAAAPASNSSRPSTGSGGFVYSAVPAQAQPSAPAPVAAAAAAVPAAKVTTRKPPPKPTVFSAPAASAPAPLAGTVMPQAVFVPNQRVAAPSPTGADVSRRATATERAATAQPSGTIVNASLSGAALSCPSTAPVAERFQIHGGGTKVMCTRGDGSLIDAVFPSSTAAAVSAGRIGYDAHVALKGGQRGAIQTSGAGGHAPSGVTGGVMPQNYDLQQASDALAPPPGYKAAWSDGRLNPRRGLQTAAGVAAQDQIWTREVPARLLADVGQAGQRVKVSVRNSDGTSSQRDAIVLSTKSDGKRVVRLVGKAEKLENTHQKRTAAKGEIQPVAAASSEKSAVSKSSKAVSTVGAVKPIAASGQGLLVQVGTFGVAANAEGAAGQLKSVGLPVARSKAGGGRLQVIYAGPFASAAEAKTALAAARSLGFGDAVILR